MITVRSVVEFIFSRIGWGWGVAPRKPVLRMQNRGGEKNKKLILLYMKERIRVGLVSVIDRKIIL